MNAVVSLSHFCETHGPTVLLSTQAFHFVGGTHSGNLEPSGIQFFGCVEKLKEYDGGLSPHVNNVPCEACESVSGYITNDYQNKTSFLSTQLSVDANVSYLLKQAAVRSLSCEVVPKKEGKVYFGDSVRGHVLSFTFFLKDAQARGFHRCYSILIFMRDKHFLLNSWSFFQEHINKIILHLQNKAVQVYSKEQNVCSQRALRLSNADQKHSVARSLVKLTASTNVFAQLHLWFTWLLSTGAKRLEEHLPTRKLDYLLKKKPEVRLAKTESEEAVLHLRQLRRMIGAFHFQRFLYSALIGRQIIVRGTRVIVEHVINLLKLFLPAGKFRCQEFGDTYRTPEVCNIIGLDLCAAVPVSSDSIMRLDIVPFRETDVSSMSNLIEVFENYHFVIKSGSSLPEKLPTLLIKIDKVLSDESLVDSVVGLHIQSLVENWLHVAEVVLATKKQEIHVSSLWRYLGVQEQDEKLIEFWAS